MTHLYHFQDLFVYTARTLGFPPIIVSLFAYGISSS
nr:MAG TPA: hypothetical protein [Caudoviricetes sp.]